MNRFDRFNLALMLTSIAVIMGYQLVELTDMRIELTDLKRMLFNRIASTLRADLAAVQSRDKGAAHAEISQSDEGGDVG